MTMKNLGLIGLITILIVFFGGFWLYRGTMPETESDNELAPSPREENPPIGNQFIQRVPTSKPPVNINDKEQPEATSPSPATSSTVPQEENNDGQVKGTKNIPNVLPEGEENKSKSILDQPGVVISMTESGFFPPSISVEAGTTVTFTNDGQVPHQPASNELPNLEPETRLMTGDVYSYTFNEPGEWNFYDETNPDFTGSIIVE